MFTNFFTFHLFVGRTGPGDSNWMHNLLFDQSGPFAYHSAVHDAFGYLKNNHNTGPGYNYLYTCSIFSTESPLAGHISGTRFWRNVLKKTWSWLCRIFLFSLEFWNHTINSNRIWMSHDIDRRVSIVRIIADNTPGIKWVVKFANNLHFSIILNFALVFFCLFQICLWNTWKYQRT